MLQKKTESEYARIAVLSRKTQTPSILGSEKPFVYPPFVHKNIHTFIIYYGNCSIIPL